MIRIQRVVMEDQTVGDSSVTTMVLGGIAMTVLAAQVPVRISTCDRLVKT